MIIDKNKQAGFSLVEVILYLAIVGILLTAVVSLHLTLGGTSSKLTSNILASRNRRVALSSIDYLINNSDGLLRDVAGDCSNFGVTPPSLALYFADDEYLPGTCVRNGGGVRISVADRKLALTCYPNMGGNGYYKNCDMTVYPAENVYYLSSSDMVVNNNSLSFTTSTATSTANNFLAVNTKLSVTTLISNQVHLRATSTATSTANISNELASGLISWWRLEASPSYTVDAQGNNNLYLTGVGVSGLINGSTNAIDFDGVSQFGAVINSKLFNFNNSFTIAAWIEADGTGFERGIFEKYDSSINQGYALYADDGHAMLRICDSNSCSSATSTTAMANDTTYHVTASYDLNNDEIFIYVYEKGDPATTTATSTFNSLKILVNDTGAGVTLGYTNLFDGTIDDVRIYNRVLSAEEIWALQSQGAS